MGWEGIDLKRWVAISAAIAAGIVGIGLLLFGGSSSDAVQLASAEQSAAELPGLPWEAEPAETLPAPENMPKMKDGVAVGGPDSMPPASAGSNGAREPVPEALREQMEAVTHGPDGRAALLLGDSAIAPFNAPLEIQGAISAANQITDQPYVWGGGHSGWRSRGYDCSGAVSYALAGGGLINRPATSGELMRWGSPGKGRWLTVYANPGHTYAVIAGLRWDTVGLGSGVGPRWHPANAYPSGYVARHIPGL
jgi:hypothetical protein